MSITINVAVAFRYRLVNDIELRLPPLTFPDNWKPETIEAKRRDKEKQRLENAMREPHLTVISDMATCAMDPHSAQNIHELTIRSSTPIGSGVQWLINMLSYRTITVRIFGFELNRALRCIYWSATQRRLASEPMTLTPEFADVVVSSGWNPRLADRQTVDLAAVSGINASGYDLPTGLAMLGLPGYDPVKTSLDDELVLIQKLAGAMGVV
jgi:hypothetical protein